jgi:phosphoglycerol transferase MdoB-like AlkP superfamily enzyme
MFSAAGVEKCFAYHNNTHTYYNRHISHPNMGYVYKAVGNGLEQYITPTWPQSDLQMIECTFADYLSDDRPFLAYYMTVSGHLDYTFVDNSMATRHKNLVKDLPYSEKVRGYKACNIELELAMKKLLEELNKAGVADRTVIAIAPDHYPYGLENETDKYSAWRELLGRDVETNFELYKSVFLLYCQGTTDAPTVDKYCASVDILPTLLNLFGLEYDSRLLSGTDILSDSEQLVIFENKSFICEAGKYNAKTKEFTLFDHVSFASEADKNAYLKYMITVVNNKFTVSKQILENDYYAKVLK